MFDRMLLVALCAGSLVAGASAVRPIPQDVAREEGFARELPAPRPLAGSLILGGSAKAASVCAGALRALSSTGTRAVQLVLPGMDLGDDAATSDEAPAVLREIPALVWESDRTDLSEADAVWLRGATAEAWGRALDADGALSRSLSELLARGGTIVAVGGVARALGADRAGVLPDVSVVRWSDPHSTTPGVPSLRIGDGAAAVVSGRIVHAAVPPAAKGEARRALARVSLSLGGDEREAPVGLTAVVDRVQHFDRLGFVRAARARAVPVIPAEFEPLERGALILGGGGQVPPQVLQRFVALAGAADGRVVVLSVRATPEPSPIARRLGRAGFGSLQVLAVDPASGDDVDLEPLERATGVWIEGGRSVRLADAFGSRATGEALHAVLARGGVVAGASAGASFQAEVLVRGGPFDTREVFVEGYHRGLGLLRGCAVDQHFSERSRFPDLLALKRRLPGVLGIGVDEGTALVIEGAVATVVGQGKVYVFAGEEAPATPREAAIALAKGERYDLAQRLRLE